MPNYVFTIFSFVAFFLCLIRFPLQLHGGFQRVSLSIIISSYYSAWSVGTHLFLAWVGLDCLFLGIDSIIWNNNTSNWAPVWCDIGQFFSSSAFS